MKSLSRSLLAALCTVISLSSVTAQETPPEAPSFAGKTIDQLDADEVLKLVRYSYTLYDRNFQGRLRVGYKERHPFVLSLQPKYMSFLFDGPPQLIVLDTKDRSSFTLLEGKNGDAPSPVAPDQYGATIRGTDVTYEDLSMRFLYWPNARIVKEEKLKNRDTWLVRVRNPTTAGNYSTVDCWIDKASGGLMKMQGYNREGRPIRRFEVLHGKKMDDIWMVDEMRIETVDPSNGKRISHTYMEINDVVN